MPTPVQDIAELSAEQVQQSLAVIEALTQEEHPEIDVGFGALRHQLLLPSAEHAAANQENIARYERSSSLKTINEDPEAADSDMVDAVLSNKSLVRQTGTKATGQVTIVVSLLAPVTIAEGTQFIGNGRAFVTETAYTAQISEDNVDSDTDRVLTPIAGDLFSFTIPVIAEETGTEYLLKKDTLLETEAVITGLEKVVATADFTGGTNTETNAQLLLREAEGLAAQALCNRWNAAALLRNEPAFANYVALSEIGLGDAEMLRDQHSIFPGSFGGRSDWYVRTAELPPATVLVKTAALIEKTVDGKGIWQFPLLRDDVPGYYDVRSIAPEEDVNFLGSYTVTAELRSTDLTPLTGELLPDIDDPLESVYSRFQSVVVQFKDSDTATSALSLGATQDYSVTVRAMPQLAELQSFVSSRAHRCLFGDVLIKAPIPCFVSLGFTLLGKAGAALPDALAIQQALASYVNRLPFTGRLFGSALATIIHGYLSDGVTVSGLDMFAKLLRPDGTIRTLRSGDVLVVPDEPANMISPRTVGFVLDPTDVRISAATLNTPEI